jgi:hypothetical protein
LLPNRHCHQESALGSAYSVIAGEKRDKILPFFASLEDWWSGLSTPLQERPYHMTGKLEIMDKNLVQLIFCRSALDRLA